MSTRANVRSGYRNRLGLIALMIIAFGGYFVYDGSYAWPRQQYIYQEFERIQKEHTDEVTGAVDDGWKDIWSAKAEANDWPIKPSEKWNRSDMDINMQFAYAALCFLIGGYFAFGWFAAGRRWIATDEGGIKTHTGEQVPWQQIKNIDKARWKSKGIAVIHYQSEGVDKTITLDDWKYETEPTSAILSEVEARTGLGQQDDSEQPTPDASQPPTDQAADQPDAASTGTAVDAAEDEKPPQS